MNTATELLRWIYDDLERDTKLPLWLRDRVRDFLAVEPEAEPVCWLCSKLDEHEKYKIEWEKDLLPYWIRRGWDVEPLYTRPEPARKPLSEEEIKAHCDESDMGTAGRTLCRLGVRFAEKHHGIGGDDE
jgi:hypothetical protein